ncbi:MAG: DJ-1 family glyoxalase III [Anaerovoracaceae bacterium]|jgi:4-methyl-5(b-hydroxyethyl)-thiazole monophosphate biosynthesis
MVYVHLAEGFEEIEVTTIVDILRRAEIETKTVSIGEKRVVGAHGVPITADLVYEEADYSTCDMIVLPGGIPGTTNLQEHKGLRESILAFASVNRWIAAICAAPMILGELGILEGKKATIYPGMEEYLVGATPLSDPVVVDGKVITSKSPGTAMVFALELVNAIKGKTTMSTVEEGLHPVWNIL